MRPAFVRPLAAGTSLALLSAVALALPASAVDANLTVTKTADVSSASAGDMVEYTINVDASGDVDGVTVSDVLPAGMSYVTDSSVATISTDAVFAYDDFDSSARSYSTGSGWTGDWVETGDTGGASSGNIVHLPFVPGLYFSIWTMGTSTPSLARTASLPAQATEVVFTFTGSAANFGSDTLVVAGLSFDGGSTYADSVDFDSSTPAGANGYELSAAVPPGATEVTVVFDVQDPGPANFLGNFGVEDVELIYPATIVEDPAGDPSAFTGPWDLTAGDSIEVVYLAQVDDVVPGSATTLTNTATVASSGDAAAGSDESTIDFIRTPTIEASLVEPDPVEVGEDLPLTVMLTHGADSDGADICAVDVQISGVAVTLESGDDAPADGCLNYGETWVLSVVLTGATGTAGTSAVIASVTALAPGDAAVTAEASDWMTVLAADSDGDSDAADDSDEPELAATGPSDATSALAIALGAMLAGGALIVLRRRTV